MVKQFVWTAAALAGLTCGAMLAVAQQQGQGSQDQSAQPGQTDQMGQMGQTGQTGQTGPGLQLTAEQKQKLGEWFIKQLASHNQLETRLGEMVAQRATDPQVRQLAQQSAEQHKQLAQTVRQSAQQAGISLPPEQQQLMPIHQAVIDYFTQLPAGEVDREYIFFEAGENQRTLMRARFVAANAQDPNVQRLATTLASAAQQQYQRVQQVAQAMTGMGGQPQPAGGQMPPGGGTGGQSGQQQGQ